MAQALILHVHLGPYLEGLPRQLQLHFKLSLKVLVFLDEYPSLLVCDLFDLTFLQLMLQVKKPDLLLLGKKLIIHPRFELFHSPAQHFELIVVLPLHFIFNRF